MRGKGRSLLSGFLLRVWPDPIRTPEQPPYRTEVIEMNKPKCSDARGALSIEDHVEFAFVETAPKHMRARDLMTRRGGFKQKVIRALGLPWPTPVPPWELVHSIQAG